MKYKEMLMELLLQIRQQEESHDWEGLIKTVDSMETRISAPRLQTVQVIKTVRRQKVQELPIRYPNGKLIPTTWRPAVHAIPAVYFEEGVDTDDQWDDALHNLRPATPAEQETIITANVKRFQLQPVIEAATSPEPIPDDEIDRDLIWFNELETARPATKGEQAKIDYTRRRQSLFQGKMKNKVSSLLIGKLTIKPEYEELDVEECPWETFDICSPKYQGNPKRSYRYGIEHQSALNEFFNSYVDPIFQCDQALLDQKILFGTFKKEKALFEDDIRFLLPVIENIRKLPDECGNSYNNDYMVWLKFWAEKAILLYGKKAVIDVY